MIAWLDGVQAWGIPLFKGGEFFTQTVFAVMSSIACSSRVLDFFVIKRNDEIDELRTEIKDELEEKPLLEEQNKQYSETQEEIESLLRQVDECVSGAVKKSRWWAIAFLAASFVLLATGTAQHVGCCPLLAFIGIAWIRHKLMDEVIPLYAKLEAKGEHFKGLRRAYNTMRDKLAVKAGVKLDKAIESVPKKTCRKRKSSASSLEAP